MVGGDEEIGVAGRVDQVLVPLPLHLAGREKEGGRKTEKKKVSAGDNSSRLDRFHPFSCIPAALCRPPVGCTLKRWGFHRQSFASALIEPHRQRGAERRVAAEH